MKISEQLQREWIETGIDFGKKFVIESKDVAAVMALESTVELLSTRVEVLEDLLRQVGVSVP